MSEVPVIEYGPVPTYYFDAISSVEVVGGNVRMTLCETRRVSGAMARVPVVDVVRPVASDVTETIERLLREQLGAATRILAFAH